MWRANKTRENLRGSSFRILDLLLTEPKIYESYFEFTLKRSELLLLLNSDHDIVQLEISMNNPYVMHALDREKQLPNDLLKYLLIVNLINILFA